MKTAIVTGASGFIAHHLIKRLKSEGYYVRGVDIKQYPWNTDHDEFLQLDLRDPYNCYLAVKGADEVYNLAADMGGMGFIHSHETDCLTNNALININMTKAAFAAGVKRYFFSSSVCVYPDMNVDSQMTEEDVYPAEPDNEYGWEKLYSERVALAYGRAFPQTKVRIARFQNIYGPECTFKGGREKAPAALSRKIIEADKEYEVWGDGRATRLFTHVDDLIDGILLLMQSDIGKPTIIGGDDSISINGLCDLLESFSGKKLKRNHVEGAVGVEHRSFDKSRIKSLGWQPKISLEYGMKETYEWIKKMID